MLEKDIIFINDLTCKKRHLLSSEKYKYYKYFKNEILC